MAPTWKILCFIFIASRNEVLIVFLQQITWEYILSFCVVSELSLIWLVFFFFFSLSLLIFNLQFVKTRGLKLSFYFLVSNVT